MKKMFLLLSCLFFSVTTVCAADAPVQEVTIGIVSPIQHDALDEIVDGFERGLREAYSGQITFLRQNAQGDLNLQRSILQSLAAQKRVDMIVAVTTGTAEMAMRMVKQKPVVTLAAMLDETQRLAAPGKNVTGVLDEIPASETFSFYQKVFPSSKKLTLIYSPDEKIFEQLKSLQRQAKQAGMVIQPLMMQQLSDLYTIGQQIAKDSDAIMILKDNRIASGIDTLVQVANKRHIPIISADEATVEHGATMALGVYEKQIGEEGAKLAKLILSGAAIHKMPMKSLDALQVFVNGQALKQFGLTETDIAKQVGHYEIVERG